MKTKYPYTGKHKHGLIVEFVGPNCGYVRQNHQTGAPSFLEKYIIGEYCGDWIEPNFEPINEGEQEMQNLKKDDIIIGSQLKAGGAVSFAKEPHVQANFIIAHQEATRLAKVDPTKKFVVVKVLGVASVPTPGILWE